MRAPVDAAHGTPAARSTSFIAGLSRHRKAVRTRGARDAARLAHLRRGHDVRLDRRLHGGDNAEHVRAFVDAVGFPLILKPRTGAGALDTTRVDNGEQLDAALAMFGGKGVTRSRSRSSSRATRASTTRCRSTGSAAARLRLALLPERAGGDADPVDLAAVRLDQPGRRGPDYAELRELGRRVNEALGIGTSATHMEWFFGPKGLKFSEIGCRPPGVGAWDLYSAGNDLDIYREWANAIVHGHVATPPVPRASPAASSRCARTGTARSPATRASTRCRPGTASG